MKNLLGLICIILCFSEVKGQTYGNEWISYEQKYYSFPIVEDGIYKIDYNSLVNSAALSLVRITKMLVVILSHHFL